MNGLHQLFPSYSLVYVPVVPLTRKENEYQMKLINHISDRRIMELERRHNFYRQEKQVYEHLRASGELSTLPDYYQRYYQRYASHPLMSDQEFLEALHQIVPGHKRYVVTEQVAQVYNLRQHYEFLYDEQGNLPCHYEAAQVRTQVHSSKKRAGGSGGHHPLFPLSEEQQKALFGFASRRILWFDLEDVLKRELTRWPVSLRVDIEPAPKRPRGRIPLAEEEKIAALEERIALLRQEVAHASSL
jgi:hypothetical protein